MNFTKLRDFLDYMAKARTPGCAVTVYLGGAKAFEYTAGVSSLETMKPLGNDFFNIYSCSKVMTVTAAAQLLEKGDFLLNDPLYEYIPEYHKMTIKNKDGSLTEAKRPITVGDLFSMTAGLNYDTNSNAIKRARELTNGRMETEAVIRSIASEPLSFEPGEGWQYSLCHDVLAGLVEITRGMKFRDYVKANILDPLGMTETYYHTPPEIIEKTAEQYRFIPENSGSDTAETRKPEYRYDGIFQNVGKSVSYILGPEYDSGGAGITTTVRDYAKFTAALANGGLGLTGERILASSTVELIKANRLNEAQQRGYNWQQLAGYGYGLGVRTHIDKAKSGSLSNLGEFGWGGAAGATVIVDTEAKLGVFFAQHTLNPREEWYQPRLRNVVYSCIN